MQQPIIREAFVGTNGSGFVLSLRPGNARSRSRAPATWDFMKRMGRMRVRPLTCTSLSTGVAHVIYGTLVIWLEGVNMDSRARVSAPCNVIAVGLLNVSMQYDGLDPHIRGLAASVEALRRGRLSQSARMFWCAGV